MTHVAKAREATSASASSMAKRPVAEAQVSSLASGNAMKRCHGSGKHHAFVEATSTRPQLQVLCCNGPKNLLFDMGPEAPVFFSSQRNADGTF